MRYYDIRGVGDESRPHLENPDFQRILVRDMSKFRSSFRAGMKPVEADGCDWRFFDREGNLRRGRTPAFWDWACHSACHWMVNTNRKLAELVEPTSLMMSRSTGSFRATSKSATPSREVSKAAPATPRERAFTETEGWQTAVIRGRLLRPDRNGFVMATDAGERASIRRGSDPAARSSPIHWLRTLSNRSSARSRTATRWRPA